MRPSCLRAPERAMPLDFGDPPAHVACPTACPWTSPTPVAVRPHGRAPLWLTQVLVQGPFLLLTYQCTSDLYYPLIFSCTSECSSEHSCLFCCTSEFECTSAHNFPTVVLYPPESSASPELSRRLSQKFTRAPFFTAARGAGSARWVTPQPRDCVSV